MAKAFAILGMLVAVCLILVFGLDLAIGIPFGKVSQFMDIAMLVCGLIVAFLGWTTFRDLR